MGFSLSKLFGNKGSKTSTASEDTVEDILQDVQNKPFGVSGKSVLYAGLNELGGYFFFQTVIVGQLQVKTKQGAQLSFSGDNFELQLDADMLEIESDHSDVKGRHITKIDFQIEQADIELLEQAKLECILVKVKNEELLFTTYVLSEEEE